LEHRLTERSRVFIFSGNPVRNMSKLIYAIFGKIYDENRSLFFFRRDGDESIDAARCTW